MSGRGGSYNASNYGMRPLTSSKRTVLIKSDFNGRGNYEYGQDVAVSAEEYVHIGDEVLRYYILKHYDTNKDGRMHINEMNAITNLSLDFSAIYLQDGRKRRGYEEYNSYKYIYIESLDALKNMPNLEILTLSDNSGREHNAFRQNNKVLTFEGNPKLKKVTMRRWYVETLDFKFNPNLKTLQIDMRVRDNTTDDGYAAVGWSSVKHKGVENLYLGSNDALRTLSVIDCDLAELDLSKNPNIERLDLRLNHLASLDISAANKLREEYIKVGYQVRSGASQAMRNVIASNVTTFNIGTAYTRISDMSSPNYYVTFETKRREENVTTDDLDKNLNAYLTSLAEKAQMNFYDWAAKQVALDAEGLDIKSIKYLDYFMPALTSLNVNDNALKELDLSGFPKLRKVYANNNNIRSININSNSDIIELEVSNNELTELPLDIMPNLLSLKCDNNSIETLYSNVCPKLIKLHCAGNALTELVMDRLTSLQELVCSDNNFTQGNLVMPANLGRLQVFEAKRALGDIAEVDLKAATGIKRINVSGNASLKSLLISENATSLQYLYAADCALNSIGPKGSRYFYFRCSGEGESHYQNLRSLVEVNIARNPDIIAYVAYNTFSFPNLRSIDVSGCDVKNVKLLGSSNCKLTRLCAGVPQRTAGVKVLVWAVNDRNWFSRWPEWSEYPENKHTTRMAYGRNLDNLEKYDEGENFELEVITTNDKKLRAAMGETFYKYMKDKLRPDSLGYRALHTADVKNLTSLECANMEVVSLGGMLEFMPNVKDIDATGNEMKEVSIPLKGLNNLNLSNNPLLETLRNDYGGCAKRIDLSHSYIDDGILNAARGAAVGGDLIVNGDLGAEELVIFTDEKSSPASLTMLSTNRSLYLHSCYIPEIKFSGKSLTFASSGKYTCKTEKLLLMNEEKPVELVFQTVDMPLLWINKWIDDNPNRKFTMRVHTGNEDVNTKINGMLSFINSTTMTGSVGKLSSEMKQMANNILLPYAYSGEVPKGARFDEVLDEFGLHETRTTDDLRMGRAMGYRLYESLKSKHAPGKEYLHVEDVKSVTQFSCADMNVPDILTVLSYMPSVTNVNASENSIRRFIVPARGIYDLSNGKVPLETLEFARKAISLDLTNTVINREVFAEAIKNVTTNLKVTHTGEALSINDSSNKLGELMILAGLNIYRCKIQTLNYRGKFLTLRGDLDAVSIGNLRLNTATNTNISFTSADVALNFIANWSQNNPVDTKFNIILLGGSVSACTSALAAFNEEAAAGRGFTEANKKLAIDAIVDCANKGYVAKGGKYDSMLDELGLAPKAKPWAVKLNSAGAHVLNVITAMRSHCGYGLLEAKRYCDNAPSVVGTFDTQEEATALKRDIENVGGLAVVLHNGVQVAEPAKRKAEAADCDVVLTSTGASKISVIRALQSVCGITLVQANTLVKTLPVVIATGKTNTEAQAIKSEIEAAGGSVNIGSPKSEFDVVLTNAGANRIAVIKALKAACGIGTLDANNLTKNLPAVVATGVSNSEAQDIKSAIEEAGGSVRIE